MRKKETTMTLTPRQYAEKWEVPYTTTLWWVKTGAIESEKMESPFGGFYFLLPADFPPPELKRGRKPGKKKKKGGK